MSKLIKGAIVRARVTASEKQDVQWAASFERLDEADIIRRACALYVNHLKSQSQPRLLSHGQNQAA